MRRRAIIDRIDDPVAVLVFDDDERTLFWPTDLLPVGAKEGDAVWLTLSAEEQECSGSA